MDKKEGMPWLDHYPPDVRHTLEYPKKILPDFLKENAALYPEHQAIIFPGEEITFADLAKRVNTMTAGLHNLGIQKGDRVAIMIPNCPQAVISYYAILQLGAIVVQTNPMYVERELEFQLQDSEASAIIVFEQLYPKVEKVRNATSLKKVIVTSIPQLGTFSGELAGDVLRYENVLAQEHGDFPGVNPGMDDVAILQYTGGTTGLSKGVMLTHRNLVANVYQVREWYGKRFTVGQERVLNVLPLFHVYAMTTAMNLGVCFAATIIMVPRFEAETVLEIIDKHKPTLFPGAPTVFIGLLNHPKARNYDLTSMWCCISGSAPLPVEVHKQWEELTGSRLCEGYGLSEAAPVTHCNPTSGRRKYGSIGLPKPDTLAKILDAETGEDLPFGEVGELVVKGPQVMKGYWKRPEETARVLKDGWLYTGDLAKMDEEGFFYIVDRKKDMIIAGGFNIYPREIEDVLYQNPKVKEVIVVGIPDPYRGETVKAFVVLKEGQQATEEELIEYCARNLARYKVPRFVEFRNELPKTAVGKLLRRVLSVQERQKVAQG